MNYNFVIKKVIRKIKVLTIKYLLKIEIEIIIIEGTKIKSNLE